MKFVVVKFLALMLLEHFDYPEEEGSIEILFIGDEDEAEDFKEDYRIRQNKAKEEWEVWDKARGKEDFDYEKCEEIEDKYKVSYGSVGMNDDKEGDQYKHTIKVVLVEVSDTTQLRPK